MSQEQLQAAVVSLEASTTAIDGQAEILRAQRKYLDSLKHEPLQTKHRSRSTRLESQNLTLAVEDSNQALTAQLRELEEGLRSQINHLGSSMSGYFRQDDCTLQRLAAESVLDLDDGSGSTAKVAKLTAKLSDFSREEIECRLDRIYLQHLVQEVDGGDDDHSGLEEQQLEQDLNSLQIEISDVAAISTFQGFQAPLLRALADHQNKRDSQARIVLEGVSNSMTNLTEAGRAWVSRLESLRSYQMAISAYRQDFDSLAQRFVTEVDSKRQTRDGGKRSLSPAIGDALSHWNVHMTEKDSAEQALRSRKLKLEQDIQRAGATVTDTLREHLQTMPMNTEQLLESGTTADQDLDGFEAEMRKLKEAVDRVDLASIDNENRAQSRFLARWSEKG